MVVLRGGGKVGKLDRIWVIMCVGMEGLCLQPKGNEGVMASNFFFFFFLGFTRQVDNDDLGKRENMIFSQELKEQYTGR